MDNLPNLLGLIHRAGKLAIGKEGQNARLAAKLTGYKIDIKAESAVHEWEEEDAAAEAAALAAEEAEDFEDEEFFDDLDEAAEETETPVEE